MTRRPRIVQHSFGAPGSGGPIGALGRVLSSDMTDRYEFLHISQRAAGGINVPLIVKMSREMRDFKPDVAHIRGLGNEGFHGVVAARVAGVPKIILSVHGSVVDLVNTPRGLRARIVAMLEPLSVRLATHVVTMHDGAKSKRSLARMGDRWIDSVPNGVELLEVSAESRSETRQTLGIDSADVVLIVVGRLVLDKGHLDLFEALALVEHDGPMHLLVVGDGPDRRVFENASASVSGVTTQFLGNRSDVANLLGASDIFVLPSLHENLSNALLEAMSAGLPVIATAVGAAPEVLANGSGILVAKSSPAELAAAIARILDDAPLAANLGRKARATIEESFTVQHMTDRLSAVYERVLNE